jgi:hypothetical protein
MTPPRRVAILSFSPIARDARVLRQLEYLARHYVVDVIGYGEPPALPTGARFWPVPQTPRWVRVLSTALLLPGRLWPEPFYAAWYWARPDHRAAYRALSALRLDVIHANDILALPAACRAAQQVGARVVMDLHEYAPLELEDRALWRWLVQPRVAHYLRRYAPRADASVTVNATIAERYARDWGFAPEVVMNVPALEPQIGMRPTDPARIQLIHHGGAMRRRQLGLMIDALAGTEARYELHFRLVGDPAYLAELRELAEQRAPGRVFFHPSVPPAQIVQAIADHDVGFYLLPPVGYNEAAASPNKFFDFVNAGLAICVGPSPEMARLVEQHGFGVVAPSFEPAEVARRLNALTPAEIDEMKGRALQARQVLNAEVEMNKLLTLYANLFAEAV